MSVEQEARQAAERRLRSAVDEYIGNLRLAEGFKRASFEELCAAIVAVGEAWRDDDVLPKRLVNLLLGLYSWIYSASYLYDAEEAVEIRRSAMEAEGLVFRHIVPAESGW